MKIVIIGDVHLAESSPRSWKVDYGEFMIEELRKAMSMGDVAVSLGDLFHRPVSSEQFKLKLIKMLRELGKPLYTLWGNHDIHNMNMEAMEKTSLRLLYELGVLNIIETSKVIEGIRFDVIPMCKNPQVPKLDIFTPNSVLLGHVFFEHPFDPKMSITELQLQECNYQYCILGHDHEPHKPFHFNKTTLLRPGSLARHTAHGYNLSRIPEVLILDVDGGVINSIETKPVDTVDSKELFHEESFNKPTKNKSTFLSSVQDLLDKFTVVSDSDKLSMAGALEKVNAPDNVKEYLKSVFERQGITF